MKAGSVLAVVAASGLAAIAAAGPALYVSSSATAAVHAQAAGQCGADLGVRVQLLPGDDVLTALDATAARLPHTRRPVLTSSTGPVTFTVVGRDDDTVGRRLVLMHRPGQEHELGVPVPDLAPGDALLPDWEVDVLGLRLGDQLEVSPSRSPAEPTVRVRYAGAYPAVPTAPVSSYWCGLARSFKPDERGDYPPPVAFVSEATLAPLVTSRLASRQWELRPDSATFTRDDAKRLSAQFDHLVDAYVASDPLLEALPVRSVSEPQRLTALVARAGQVARTVSKTAGPVALAGFVATAGVLIAAGLLVGRARQRELRLLGVRGVPASAVWARLARSLATPVSVGATIGIGLTIVAVQAVGPAPRFEARVVRQAVGATVAAAAAALVILIAVAHASGQRLVDRPARHRRAWLRRTPWELLVVASAAASYRRLDRFGGVQLVGAKAYGGDVLAQAYPLLLLVAVLAALARPMVFAARRARFVGRRWRPSLQIGMRRVVAEPGVSVGLLLATALAVAALVSARVLTDSAVRALDDKARTYLGSDLAIATNGPVDGLAPASTERSTLVRRQDVRAADGVAVQLLGVDPDTFARAVVWRGDEAPASLPAVLAQLRVPVAGGALPAIVVGPAVTGGELIGPGGGRVNIAPVAALSTFPGFRNPGPVVVVDRAALARTDLSFIYELWWRAPPPDAVAQVRATGVRVYSATAKDTIFDTTSFLAVRWSYGLLAAFGVVIAAVTALAQLLVIDARRRSRQSAYVLTERMGLGRRDQFVSLLVEVGVPIACGCAVGLVLGVAAARTSVARLDTLRNLQPRTVAIVAVGPTVAVAAAALGVAILLAVCGLVGIVRTRPMEVLRETA